MIRRIGLLLGILLGFVGVGLIGWGVLTDNEPAPMPEREFLLAASDVTVAPAETADLPPNTIWIPALDVTGPVGFRDVFRSLPGPREVAQHDETSALTASEGTTLIAGHVSSRGVPGLLKHTASLNAGDRVYVTTDEGTVTAWMVVGVKANRKNALPADLLDTTGERRLALVTCGGKVITRRDGSRHYDSNVIAYAVPVPGEEGDHDG